jgi:PAS domain S-box-containing protein
MIANNIESIGNPDLAPDPDEVRVRGTQVLQIYDHAPTVVWGAAFATAVMAAAVWSVRPHWLITAWIMGCIVVYGGRLWLVSRFGREAPVGEALIRWGAWYALGNFFAAIVWGLGAILLFPPESELHQALLTAVLCGTCAGTIAAYSPLKEAYLPFVVVVMVSTAGRHMYEADYVHITTGALVIVYGFCVIVVCGRLNAMNTESIKLRFRNEELVSELTKKESKTQALNQELKSEVEERKQAEEALQLSGQRYRQLVDNANDFIYVLDTQGRFTFVNPVALRITGYSEEEILGKHYHSLIPEACWMEMDDIYRSQYCNRSHESYIEIPLITKRGDTIWTGQNLLSMLEGEQIKGFQGICRDITDRRRAEDALRLAYDTLEIRVEERTAELSISNDKLKQEILERERAERLLEEAHFRLEERAKACFLSEERFRAVFQAAEDCIFIKDLDLRYTHVNPAMLGLLGMDEATMYGKTDEDVFGSEYASQTIYLERRVLAGETVETEHSVNWMNWAATMNFVRFPMSDASKKTLGICGIARDVTDRPQREGERLAEASGFASAEFLRTLEQVRMAAENESMVLFLGESGTGKDWLARYLHDHSNRANGPYFAINCAALNPDLIESELFGHEAGAFTGAKGRKRGLLELAEGGTLLLNEIGELSWSLQAKLLSFLDTKSLTRVGGEKAVSPNARIAAATNRDLEQDVEQGLFRKDLFYRLNVFTVTVPPLRDRPEDIPILVRSLLQARAKEFGISAIPTVDDEAKNSITRYSWPGNVRELANVLERGLILSRGKTITAADLAFQHETGSQEVEVASDSQEPFPFQGLSFNEALETTKRVMITSALDRSGGSIKDAAELLGLTYGSIRHHIQTLGIHR